MSTSKLKGPANHILYLVIYTASVWKCNVHPCSLYSVLSIMYSQVRHDREIINQYVVNLKLIKWEENTCSTQYMYMQLLTNLVVFTGVTDVIISWIWKCLIQTKSHKNIIPVYVHWYSQFAQARDAVHEPFVVVPVETNICYFLWNHTNN